MREAAFIQGRKKAMQRSIMQLIWLCLFLLCAVCGYQHKVVPVLKQHIQQLKQQMNLQRSSQPDKGLQWYRLHQKRLLLLRHRQEQMRQWHHAIMHLFAHKWQGMLLRRLSWQENATSLVFLVRQLSDAAQSNLLLSRKEGFGRCQLGDMAYQAQGYKVKYACREDSA